MTVKTANLVAGVALTNADATYYTSPVNITTRIVSASATNTGAATVKLTINVVRSGGSVGVLNTRISALPIAGGLSYLCPELFGVILGPGDFLSAKDDTGAVTSLEVDGYQIS